RPCPGTPIVPGPTTAAPSRGCRSRRGQGSPDPSRDSGSPRTRSHRPRRCHRPPSLRCTRRGPAGFPTFRTIPSGFGLSLCSTPAARSLVSVARRPANAYVHCVAGDRRIETDYLVVGAGALGMSFVDSLLEHSDADVVMVERRHRPAGHWLDSYPFVQLHQPSRFYGVDSSRLGEDRIERDGTDAGFYERASGAEICGYYDEIMRHRFLTSGRVRFFP